MELCTVMPADVPALDAINEAAFPPEERVAIGDLIATGDGRLDLLGIRDDAGTLAGFLAVRRYERVQYLAYLAVAADRRSQGLGSRALALLRGRAVGDMLVVEFETPDGDPIRARRRAFYERAGFTETGWYSTYDGAEFSLACAGPFDKAAFDRFVAYLRTIVPDFIPVLYRKDT